MQRLDQPVKDRPTSSNTADAKSIAAGSNHIDLFLLNYLYLRTPKNTNLRPTVFNVGPILVKMSPRFAAPYWGKLRGAAIERDFTEPDKASKVHRKITPKALARLSALGFINPADNSPTALGKAVLKAIHQFANEVRKEKGLEISGRTANKFSMLTKGDVVSIVDVAKDTEVARFTAPDDLPKRTAPENRKNPHPLTTKHSEAFIRAVARGVEKTGLTRREMVETALTEFLEKQGIFVEDEPLP